MMMQNTKYSYHFSLHLMFKKDIDVDLTEEHFGIKAYKKTSYNEFKGKEKMAKLWYKSKEFTDVNTHLVLEAFIQKMATNFKDLKDYLESNDGSAVFTLYFTNAKERPIIELTTQAIDTFQKLGLSFEVDFNS